MAVKENHHDKIWDSKISPKYDSKINLSNRAVLEIMPPVSSVLDVGCGTGQLLLPISRAGIKAEGVDISKSSLKELKKKGLKAKQADLDEGLPYSSNKFDCVICSQVMMHILEPTELTREMKRVSKKYVIINIPNHLYWRHRVGMLFGKLPIVLDSDTGHIRLFTLSKAEKMISDAGLKIISTNHTGKKFFPSLFSTGFTFLCKK